MKTKKILFIKRKKKSKFKFQKELKNKSNNYYKCLLKIFIMLFLFLLYFKIKGNTKKIFEKKNLTEQKYFSCFVAKVKNENRYIRESVEHYLSIGVDKFFFADDNELDGEKISDVLQDYIDKGIITVKDFRGKNIGQSEYYQYELVNLKNICKWIIYFDIDEFLEFKDKNMTIKEYLSLENFNKCEVIKIHWLVYYDNDLVYYDNRPLEQRFTKPNEKSFDNKFHKSIVRVKDYNITMWENNSSPHQPNESLTYSCDATGRYSKQRPGILGTPNYKYCYLKHFSGKSVEEIAWKILRGGHRGIPYNYNQRLAIVDNFFKHNKVTEEKISILEKKLNMTFPIYHK